MNRLNIINDLAKEKNITVNDAEKIFMDESKEFVGFAFASEKVEEYPEEPQSFQEAWQHSDPTDREGWRDAIRKEFSDILGTGENQDQLTNLISTYQSEIDISE